MFASIVNVELFVVAPAQQRLNDILGHVDLLGTVDKIPKQIMDAVEKQANGVVGRQNWPVALKVSAELCRLSWLVI